MPSPNPEETRASFRAWRHSPSHHQPGRGRLLPKHTDNRPGLTQLAQPFSFFLFLIYVFILTGGTHVSSEPLPAFLPTPSLLGVTKYRLWVPVSDIELLWSFERYLQASGEWSFFLVHPHAFWGGHGSWLQTQKTLERKPFLGGVKS